jgi:hypothetical protein
MGFKASKPHISEAHPRIESVGELTKSLLLILKCGITYHTIKLELYLRAIGSEILCTILYGYPLGQRFSFCANFGQKANKKKVPVRIRKGKKTKF